MNVKILTLSLISFCLCSNAIAKDYIIALSPHQSQTDATSQFKSLILFLTTLDEGDSALLLDGYSIKTIGTFTVPMGKAYQSPKARISKNRSVIAAYKHFTNAANLPSGENSVYQAVRMPQLLHHIARNIGAADKTDVIILGSPLYDDPNDKVFSMANGLIPSDGHLKASRLKTPFGTLGTENILNNVQLHLVFTKRGTEYGDAHAFALERFWALYMKLQSGNLASFSSDLPSVLARIKNNVPLQGYDFELGKETALEMIRFVQERADKPIQDRPLSTVSLSPFQIKHAENVEIYLSWDCASCDLDLHARSNPNAAVIYFNRSATAEGVHFKDFRSSPKANNAYETIAYHVPVDLNKLQIIVNFFYGESPNGVKAELRLSVDGLTYGKTFHIAAHNGNGGLDVTKVFKSGHSDTLQTFNINPLTLLRG